jgi:hypothetical protein
MLNWALQFKSPLPKQDMTRKFMCKKFNFSIQGCAILFTCTTIFVSPNQVLKFLNPNSTPMVRSLLLFTLNQRNEMFNLGFGRVFEWILEDQLIEMVEKDHYFQC